MMEFHISTFANAVVAWNMPLPKASQIPERPDFRGSSLKIEYWGGDNLYPQWVYEQARQNSIIPQTIQKQIDWAAAIEIRYGIPDYDAQGKKTYRFRRNAALENFLRQLNFEAYKNEALTDYFWFNNIFPTMHRSRKTGKIEHIFTNEAMFSRYSKPHENGSLYPRRLYVCADWSREYSDDSDYIKSFPIIDRYSNPKIWLDLAAPEIFVYPLFKSSPGASQYQESPWHSIFPSNWFSVAQSIPLLKKAIMSNGMLPLYKVTIMDEYWLRRFPEFNQLSKDEKINLMDKERARIEQFLSGAQNAGKAFFLPGKMSKLAGEEVEYIKIDLIKANTLSGELIPESQESASHILYAIGVPQSLIGNGIGKNGIGAGSGSDVFEHLRNYLLLMRSSLNLILEPFNRLALPYNGWEDELYFAMPALEARADIAPDLRNLNNAAE